MSWHKITLKLLPEIDPQVVEIGKLGWEVFERENEPAGFAMLHATRASENDMDDKFLVYLSPVASELCTEIAERYTLEPCDVPARDEPDAAWVFGDPLVKGWLKDKFEPEPGSVEWNRAEAAKKKELEDYELFLVQQAEFEAALAKASQAKAEETQSDSAKA
jgi:hypothetical protein